MASSLSKGDDCDPEGAIREVGALTVSRTTCSYPLTVSPWLVFQIQCGPQAPESSLAGISRRRSRFKRDFPIKIDGKLEISLSAPSDE